MHWSYRWDTCTCHCTNLEGSPVHRKERNHHAECVSRMRLWYEIYFYSSWMTKISSWYEGVQWRTWEIWWQVSTSTCRYVWAFTFLHCLCHSICHVTQVLCCVDKFYLVDSGYPNRLGFLAPYRGTKYHVPEWREGPAPRGKKELFNYTHSSLRKCYREVFWSSKDEVENFVGFA